MNDQNAEIERLKAAVSCAVLLERLPPVWRLDRAESTRQSLKYRRGKGEIVIINHDGRGWWDPLSDRKGDIFTLIRHLEPGLNFGEARRRLRGFMGIAPAFPEALRTRRIRLHDYFIARSIARLRPGRIALFVTSTGTMDKVSTTAREHIASMADLVGAVRLPEGSMRAAAGTDVVIDLLVFQRRVDDQPAAGGAWIDLADSAGRRRRKRRHRRQRPTRVA